MPLPLLAVGALAGAGAKLVGNIFSGIQGNRMGRKQMRMGQDMINEAQKLSAAYQRPEMQTPEAIKMQMEMAQGRQFQNMPGFTQMQNQINQATAGGVNAMQQMGTGSEAFGGVANLYANQMNQQSQNSIQNAQFQNQAQDQYQGLLGNLGNWQQQAWQWNEADPYMQAQQKAAQLEMMGRQGQWEGMKNKMGSWAETFQGAGDALGDMAPQLAASGLFGGGGKGATGLLGGIGGLFGGGGGLLSGVASEESARIEAALKDRYTG
ncbi:hypothetical protein KKC59_04925 [bacterium]|nr:hypothetical protein [bacterium]MBU1613610.1 hypothetical protein [Patescibacteria group bacterium]